MSDTIKDRVHREVESLSPEEAQVIHQLIRTFKGRSSPADDSPSASADAARRVRAALADLSGSLSETISDERADRV
jgi:hypothetical protein